MLLSWKIYSTLQTEAKITPETELFSVLITYFIVAFRIRVDVSQFKWHTQQLHSAVRVRYNEQCGSASTSHYLPSDSKLWPTTYKT